MKLTFLNSGKVEMKKKVFIPSCNDEEKIILPIQINGKRKTEISVAPDITETALKEIVLNERIVKKALTNSNIKRFIYVAKRIVNVVI